MVTRLILIIYLSFLSLNTIQFIVKNNPNTMDCNIVVLNHMIAKSIVDASGQISKNIAAIIITVEMMKAVIKGTSGVYGVHISSPNT